MGLQIPDSALSSDGYIIDQGKLGGIKYGFGTSDRNGCGWVAVYNAAKALGETPDVEEIIKALNGYLNLFGCLGTSSKGIIKYFEGKGYVVKKVQKKHLTEEELSEKNVYVLWYMHKKGAHFATFVPLGTKDYCRFFNMKYGAAFDYGALNKVLEKEAESIYDFILVIKR